MDSPPKADPTAVIHNKDDEQSEQLRFAHHRLPIGSESAGSLPIMPIDEIRTWDTEHLAVFFKPTILQFYGQTPYEEFRALNIDGVVLLELGSPQFFWIGVYDGRISADVTEFLRRYSIQVVYQVPYDQYHGPYKSRKEIYLHPLYPPTVGYKITSVSSDTLAPRSFELSLSGEKPSNGGYRFRQVPYQDFRLWDAQQFAAFFKPFIIYHCTETGYENFRALDIDSTQFLEYAYVFKNWTDKFAGTKAFGACLVVRRAALDLIEEFMDAYIVRGRQRTLANELFNLMKEEKKLSEENIKSPKGLLFLRDKHKLALRRAQMERERKGLNRPWLSTSNLTVRSAPRPPQISTATPLSDLKNATLEQVYRMEKDVFLEWIKTNTTAKLDEEHLYELAALGVNGRSLSHLRTFEHFIAYGVAPNVAIQLPRLRIIARNNDRK